MKHSSTAQTMRHLRFEVMEMCEDLEFLKTLDEVLAESSGESSKTA